MGNKEGEFMEKKYENPVKSLTDEIYSVQLDNYCRNIDETVKRVTHRNLKQAAAITIPTILLMGTGAVIANPIPFFAGIAYMAAGTIYKMTIDTKNKLSAIKKIEVPSQPFSPTVDEDVLTAANKKVFKVQEKDLYTPEYQEIIANAADHEVKAHGPMLVYNKEETIARVSYEMEAYTSSYELPPLKITSEEWSLFYDTIYNFLKDLGMEVKYYDFVSQIVRYSLARTLVNKNKSFSLYSLLDNLSLLEQYGFTATDIANIKEEIISKLPNQEKKVIDIRLSKKNQ